MGKIENYNFNAKEAKKKIINWIREWFNENGPDCKAIIGISGGKDSTIVAALCAEALGTDKVIGVAMPSEGQGLNDADKICKYLGIRLKIVGISEVCNIIRLRLGYGIHPHYALSKQSEQNIPPRVRMTMLYAISQTENGRVACCDNASERYVGYFTRYGDGCGDFGPLADYTVTEVRAIGKEFGLPSIWVDKVPDDGLPNSAPDAEKLGFTYESLDKYIREGICEDEQIKAKIDALHNKNKFKLSLYDYPKLDV